MSMKARVIKVERLRLEMVAPDGHPEAGKVVQVDKTVIETDTGTIMQFVGTSEAKPGDIMRVTFGAPVLGLAQ